MTADLTPMRWPPAWKDASALQLLKGTPIDCLLFDESSELTSQAEAAGFHTGQPTGVTVVKGLWPGIRLSSSGARDNVSTGPTGVPWVDSNGWRIRLAAALDPTATVWVEAAPRSASYRTAIADAAAAGGRWIIALENNLASALALREPSALTTWKRLTDAAAFFNAHKQWNALTPQAVVGIVSDFTGPNAAFAGELVNLIGRGNQQYRVLPQSRLTIPALQGLTAVIYADPGPPTALTRNRLLGFSSAGGLVIAGPKSTFTNLGTEIRTHPRFSIQKLGRGLLAIADNDMNDPYLVANDAAVIVSHRNDLLLFWNGGALTPYLSATPDHRKAVLQIVFYANRSTDDASLRVAGSYKTAKLFTLDHPEPRTINVEPQTQGVELHLPAVAQYAAIELAE